MVCVPAPEIALSCEAAFGVAGVVTFEEPVTGVCDVPPGESALEIWPEPPMVPAGVAGVFVGVVAVVAGAVAGVVAGEVGVVAGAAVLVFAVPPDAGCAGSLVPPEVPENDFH